MLIEDREAAELLSVKLAPVAHLPLLVTTGFITCPARHLAGAAALLGKPNEARDQYRQAMEASARIRNVQGVYPLTE